MKTAKEFLEETFKETGFHISNTIAERMVIAAMQVYAESHVSEALKSAAKKALVLECTYPENGEGVAISNQTGNILSYKNKNYGVCSSSILNAYNLDNIK